MNYFDLRMPLESSWYFLESLGSMNMVHFMDNNLNVPISQRHASEELFVCQKVSELIG